jgi:outer membrane receptor protein involved in Fe transport
LSRKLIAPFALAALAAHAHDPGRETIDVTGHYENAVGTSDAASAGFITPALIDDRPLLRPGEVLEAIPGMIVTQHSGAGKANQYFLRGFNLDHGTDFATTVAGMPVNLRTHAHGQGYTDLNFMIPELVSRIDYYKGPYYAAQGDFATAGAADIRYRNVMPSNAATAMVGNAGYARFVATGTEDLGDGHLLYGIEAFHNDGPWTHPDDARKVNGVLRWSMLALNGAVWSVTAMGYGSKWNSTDQIPRRAVDEGLIGRWDATDPTDGGESHRYSLSGEYDGPFAWGRLRASAYAIRYDLSLFSNFTYFLDDPVHGDQFNQVDRRRTFGTLGNWSRVDALAGLPLTTTLGWDVREDRLDPVALYSTEARERLSTTREDRVREMSYAVYAQAELQWRDWMRAIAGLRGDRYSFRVDSDNPANSGSRDASIGSPKLSLIFGPWSQTEWFVNYGEGFHSNDARGMTTRVDPSTGEAVTPATPLVRTRGGELGLRSEIVPNLQTSLALWALKFDSELVFLGDAGTTEAGRPSKRDGIEWSNRYAPFPWMLVDLDLAYTRARFSDDDPAGNHIPNALQAAAAGGITLRNLGPWTASLFGRYFGPRPLIEDDSVRSGSTAAFNFQATYRVSPALRLRFDVFNLFDRKADDIAYYYASRLPGEPAAGVNDVHFHPMERRSARVGGTFSF